MKPTLRRAPETWPRSLWWSLLVCAGLTLAGASLPRSAEGQQAPTSAGPVLPELLDDLVAANRILAAQGVLDGYGHVSVRHDKNPNRYLLSRSLAPELVTADDIMEFDLESKPVDARGRATYTELFIHGEIYKARPDVKAVVHNHSPAVIPFGVTGQPLRPLYHMSAFIAEGVPVFDIRKASGQVTDMLISNVAFGGALAKTLGNHPAALMRGHGAVVVGPTLPRTVARSVYLQMNASLQLQAMTLGGNITYLDVEEARKVETSVWDREGFRRAWELWKRKALGK